MLKLRARPDKKRAYCSEVVTPSQQIRALRPPAQSRRHVIGQAACLSPSFDVPSHVLW